MASVVPKMKLYLFVGIVSLMINLCASGIFIAISHSNDVKTGVTDADEISALSKKPPRKDYSFWDWFTGQPIRDALGNAIEGGIFAGLFVFGGSFLPFVDLLAIVSFQAYNYPMFATMWLIVIAIFGAIKLFMLITVIANFVPTVNI